MSSEVIKLSDILDTAPIKPVPMDAESRQKLLDEVAAEMKRLGIDKLNEATRRSEIMTAKDYAVRVGPCS